MKLSKLELYIFSYTLSEFAASLVHIFARVTGFRCLWRTLSRMSTHTQTGSCSSEAIEVLPARRFSAPCHQPEPRIVSQYRLCVPAACSDSSDASGTCDIRAEIGYRLEFKG